MRASDIKGKVVAGIRQERVSAEDVDGQRGVYDLHTIFFTDGSMLKFQGFEKQADYGVQGFYHKPPRDAAINGTDLAAERDRREAGAFGGFKEQP